MGQQEQLQQQQAPPQELQLQQPPPQEQEQLQQQQRQAEWLQQQQAEQLRLQQVAQNAQPDLVTWGDVLALGPSAEFEWEEDEFDEALENAMGQQLRWHKWRREKMQAEAEAEASTRRPHVSANDTDTIQTDEPGDLALVPSQSVAAAVRQDMSLEDVPSAARPSPLARGLSSGSSLSGAAKPFVPAAGLGEADRIHRAKMERAARAPPRPEMAQSIWSDTMNSLAAKTGSKSTQGEASASTASATAGLQVQNVPASKPEIDFSGPGTLAAPVSEKASRALRRQFAEHVEAGRTKGKPGASYNVKAFSDLQKRVTKAQNRLEISKGLLAKKSSLEAVKQVHNDLYRLQHAELNRELYGLGSARCNRATDWFIAEIDQSLEDVQVIEKQYEEYGQKHASCAQAAFNRLPELRETFLSDINARYNAQPSPVSGSESLEVAMADINANMVKFHRKDLSKLERDFTASLDALDSSTTVY